MSFNNHFNNLSKLTGHDVRNKYSLIINQSDFVNEWVKMHDELSYPLMIESKKRRMMIYNKKGIEKQIENMITNVILNLHDNLSSFVVNDIVSDIANQLNNLTQNSKGTIVIGGKNKHSYNSNYIIKALTKGIVNGLDTIIDNITGIDE